CARGACRAVPRGRGRASTRSCASERRSLRRFVATKRFWSWRVLGFCRCLVGFRGDVGEVGGAEADVPDAVVVVLRAAQVQGECLVEQAEAGEGLLEPVDGLGGRFEDLVEVVG